MRRRTSLVVVVIALFGCAQQPFGEATTWAKLKVETLQLELVHEQKVEVLKFGPLGTVSATVGIKGGALAGPIWYWRVEGEHLIISEQPRSASYLDLYAPQLNGNFLFVKRGAFSNAKYAVKYSDA